MLNFKAGADAARSIFSGGEFASAAEMSVSEAVGSARTRQNAQN